MREKWPTFATTSEQFGEANKFDAMLSSCGESKTMNYYPLKLEEENWSLTFKTD